MKRKTFNLRYGKDGLTVEAPDSAAVLEGRAMPALPDPVAAVRQGLERPIGCEPLAELVRRKQPRSVAITISDITRPVPNESIVTALLDVLNAQGINDEQVVVIIGTGMHRPSTPEERQILLGDALLKRIRVEDHKADDAGGLVRISDDPPVALNKLFAEADFRIVTGLIEPHFMAGYSGGRKGVCPALVDLETVQRFHGYKILSSEKSAAGILEGNPCHEVSLRIAKLVGVDFLVNVAIGEGRKLAGVYAGDMEAAHAVGCHEVGQATGVTVEKPYDLVITHGGGFPLDQTFYQTVKGMVAALPALHDGSTLLIASDCGEGVGSQTYEQTMTQWHTDWRGFLDDIAGTPRVVKDQWQYQMHCRVLERTGVERLQLVCDGLPMERQRTLAVTPVNGEGRAAVRLQRAVDTYVAAHPDASVAVIPEGPYTMLLEE